MNRITPKAWYHDIYRDEQQELSVLLQEAIHDFRDRYRALPAEIVVPKSQMAAARSVLKELGLGNVPVATTGGCLQGEVWMGVPDEKQAGFAQQNDAQA